MPQFLNAFRTTRGAPQIPSVFVLVVRVRLLRRDTSTCSVEKRLLSTNVVCICLRLFHRTGTIQSSTGKNDSVIGVTAVNILY